ncbi:hypothetical protein TMatcc_001999 [Talaromyces marneffei ATCC 18224]|uniref:BTB domain-containing protein n=1 Tax=Talaromyces marneffei (strain ATCC 18224 / CBS 334.59 / QM 7333) TaxID=441960 RepID=B6QIE3_TALMQ|nr:uncharacterized protein EYB26_006819 [Talaromyces marneffei]EEA23138.1 conserved hypothetical protein [Talaromyces marneffei ATCC 18224]KAE8551995.1 hypothetical protein EYB25_005886 [Talaromyces marneffei]QGA19131.1 hypothetical protein EYB26_006819 [Talaromyces marneffei]
MDVETFKKENVFTLVCHKDTFVVHRSIVCEQSTILNNAYNSRLKEGLTKQIEVHFEKETLQHMLNYMYRGKYDGPSLHSPEPRAWDNWLEQGDKSQPVIDLEDSKTEPESLPMFDMLRPHILVNSIADYYDVPGLKQQANENISYILKRS